MFTTSIMFITNISYLLKMTKKNKLSSQKRLAIAGFFAIFIALLFMISSVPAQAGIDHSQQETGFTTTSYIPNPTMNSNITWSTFNSRYAELEYQNDTGHHNLTAQPNPQYANPITINPANLIMNGTLQNDKINNKTWNVMQASHGATATYSITSDGNITMGGIKEPYTEVNTSQTENLQSWFSSLPKTYLSQLPVTNPAYDYFTVGAEILAPTPYTGINLRIQIVNGTGNQQLTGISAPANTPVYISMNLNQLKEKANTVGLNTTGKNKLDYVEFFPNACIPKTTINENIQIVVFAYGLTTYPILIGQNATGSTPTEIIGNAHLNKFKPTADSTVYNGYTVAVSQEMQKTTESQSSINTGNYIEQVTYQGIFQLPTAPDLTYSVSTISLNMSIAGNQYEVANLNGISYLSAITTLKNGTFVFGTINPNAQNTLILETEFTAQQWNASTSAPSFFSVQGLEYYWWVGLIGLMSIIGLGAAASSHFSGEEENLKIPKGKLGR